jgi:hypothetical protein
MSNGSDRTTLIVNLCVVVLALAVVAETNVTVKAFYKTDTVGVGVFLPIVINVPFLFVLRRRGVSVFFLIMYLALFFLLAGPVWSAYRGLPLRYDAKGLTFFQDAAFVIGLVVLLCCLIRAVVSFVATKLKSKGLNP